MMSSYEAQKAKDILLDKNPRLEGVLTSMFTALEPDRVLVLPEEPDVRLVGKDTQSGHDVRFFWRGLFFPENRVNVSVRADPINGDWTTMYLFHHEPGEERSILYSNEPKGVVAGRIHVWGEVMHYSGASIPELEAYARRHGVGRIDYEVSNIQELQERLRRA